MRFAPSDEQHELQAVVRELLTERCTPAIVRCAPGSSELVALAASLAELGVAGLLVPEADGGLGLDENHLVTVFEQIGYAAAPLPLIGTVAVAPGVLAAIAYERLPDLLSGTLWVGADPSLTGQVPFGSSLSLVVGGGFGGTGRLELLDVAGAALQRIPSVDAQLDLGSRGNATFVGAVDAADDPALVRRTWERGVLAASAELLGLSRRMMDLAVEHVRTREQFGVPVGSFQAVKHQLATAAVNLEFAAPMMATAAYEVATGAEDRTRTLATAKALVSDAAHVVGRTALQVHGAIGYTTEYDLQLFLKRSWALEASWGSAAWHRAALLDEVGLGFTGTRPAS